MSRTLVKYRDILKFLEENLLSDNVTIPSKLPYWQKFVAKSLKDAYSGKNSELNKRVLNWLLPENFDELLKAADRLSLEEQRDKARQFIISHCFNEQREVLLSKNIRNICILPRQSGKSEAIASSIVYQALEPNTPLIYIAKSFTIGKKTIFDRIEALSNESGLVIERLSKNDGTIKWANGSNLIIKGNNDISSADSVRGLTIRCIYIDEIAHQKNVAYLLNDVLRPMTLKYGPDLIILAAGTPPKIRGTYLEKVWNGDTEWKKFYWNGSSNPAIPDYEQFIKDIMKEEGLTEENSFIRREYRGSFEYSEEFQVFPHVETYDDLKVELDRIRPLNLIIGIDPGTTLFNGITTLFFNKQTKEAIAYRSIKFNHSTTEVLHNHIDMLQVEMIEAMQPYAVSTPERKNIYGKVMEAGTTLNPKVDIIVDCLAAQVISDLRYQFGHKNVNGCKKPPNGLIATVDSINRLLNQKKLKLLKNDALTNEMTIISWEEDEQENPILGEFNTDTIEGHADLTMSFVYAMREYLAVLEHFR